MDRTIEESIEREAENAQQQLQQTTKGHVTRSKYIQPRLMDSSDGGKPRAQTNGGITNTVVVVRVVTTLVLIVLKMLMHF